MFSCRKHVDESLQSSVVEKFVACEAGISGGIALFRASCVASTARFGDFDADLRCLEWFVPGIHGEVGLYQSGLTLFGAIGTVWRTDIAVFGVCDAAKWCQYLRDLGLRHVAVAGFDP